MFANVVTVLAASAAMVGAALAPAQADPTPAQEPPAAIVVEPGQATGSVSQQVFGVNHRYGYDGFGSFDPTSGAVDQKLVDEVKSAKVRALRFPGGTIANRFHWARAIGPQAQRGCQTHGSTGSGEPLDSDYGPDEHARFAEQVGATDDIVVNFATGTPQEAADWVEYMNTPVGQNPDGGVAWAELRARNGHPAPYHVGWWEVGNEMDSLGQSYWMGPGSVQDRAHKYAFGGSTTFTAQPMGVGCDQRSTANTSTGAAGQRFEVYYPPVVEDSQTVFVDGEAWTQVPSLDTAGPGDRVYTFDPASGRATFGDGTHGAIPPEGARVTASYTSGPHAGFVDFAKAMKAADPRIRVCPAFTNVAFLDAMGQEAQDLDCMTVHNYSNIPTNEATATDAHDHVIAQGDSRANDVATWKQRLDAATGGRAGIALSEYGMYQGGYVGSEHYLRSLDQGLLEGSQLASWIRLGIPLAEKHSLVDFDPDAAPPGSQVLIGPDQSLFGWAPSYVPSAPAQVLQLYTHMTGSTVVASAVTGNPVRDGARGTYADLVVTATTDGDGHLYLVVVNRDPEKDVTAHISHPGFRSSDNAAVWTVNGPHTYSYNSPGDESAVALTRTNRDVEPDGFDYVFPAHSVTGISVPSS